MEACLSTVSFFWVTLQVSDKKREEKTRRREDERIDNKIGAHFHIPPEWLTASMINNQTYVDMLEILEVDILSSPPLPLSPPSPLLSLPPPSPYPFPSPIR